MRGARGNGVAARVADAITSAEVDLVKLQSDLAMDPGPQVEHRACGFLEGLDDQDLRADVRMQADEPQIRRVHGFLDGLPSGAARDRQTEFLILHSGGHVFVAAGVHPGRHPEHDGGDGALVPRDRIDELQLGQRIDDEMPDFRPQSELDLFARLVVAVHPDAAARNARGQRRAKLPLGTGVHSEPFVCDGLGYGYAQKSLARVVDVSPPEAGEGLVHGLFPGARPGAQHVLVKNVKRRAVLRRQLAHADAADCDLAADAAGRRRPRPVRRAVGLGRGKVFKIHMSATSSPER